MGAPTISDRESGVPGLEPGITRLRCERGTTGLHRLVAATLETATGPAYWVDAGNEAAPRALFRATADRLSLSRLRVARAFTAYQHHSLVEALARRVDADTSLVVASSLPALYADDDLLAGEGERLFCAGVKRLLRLRRRLDVPVLVTHAPAGGAAGDDFAGLLSDCADRTVDAVETDHGVRFAGDGVETARYDAGLLDQATLAAFAAADADDSRDPAAPRPPAASPPGIAAASQPAVAAASPPAVAAASQPGVVDSPAAAGDRSAARRPAAGGSPADRRAREEVRA